MATEGMTLNNHREAPSSYLADGDMGRHGGGTLTSHSVEPTLEAYENIFGPSARDIKQDLQRFKRHGRWHLPDILKGPNQYLTDRVDGLITDATNSPFTSRILPYKYITNVDGKIKWNVWSFDEGLASRVPYEAAARTLTQSKRSFAGYFIRQGMAIVLEHNFMMTEAGRENFKRQLNQLVGSIQLTNDLDVHVALILAPSYQKHMNEKYLSNDKSSAQICREFVDLFGFVQKNQNALDILIEEAKSQLRTWGAPMPDFMLCNSKLTFQLTMTPDQTNYVTKGPEGVKRLKNGPDLPSYRGIGIVHTRAFSMETGTPPRDVMRRRVRVAEYHRIAPHKDNHKRGFQLYNEERDTLETFTFQDLLQMALCDRKGPGRAGHAATGADNNGAIANVLRSMRAGLHPEVKPAAHLAGVMPAGLDTMPLTGFLTHFFEQHLLKQNVPKNFTWDPEYFNDNILFVPGAVDMSDWPMVNNSDLTQLASFDAFPDFLKTALKLWHDKDNSPSAAEQNRARIVSQSLAPYHRNYLADQFLDKITRTSAYNNRNTDKPATFETMNIHGAGIVIGNANYATIAAYAGATLPQKTAYVFYNSLMLRNYLRYGTPSAILRSPAVQPANGQKFDDVFNFVPDFKTMNYMDQHLRSRGAWFSPNHFKVPNLILNSLGDFVGYHMLVTRELVESCILSTARPNPNTAWHIGTLLYDVIMNSSAHRPLYNAVNAIFQDAAVQALVGNNVNRAQLYNDIGKRIKTALANHAATLGTAFTAQKDGLNMDIIDARPYWYMPRTEKVSDEVYSSTRAAGTWKNQLWNTPNFQQALTFTDGISAAIETDAAFDTSAGDSPKHQLLLPGRVRQSSDEARNFFCMLAWRLWADQEIPLTTVYDVNAMAWSPVIENHLFPRAVYPYAHPGQGLMLFGDPSASALPGASAQEARMSQLTENIEIVIVRPNIEHYMLGIILGQGGEGLGSTFWGQTELSCYDDSMYGIWGMSYKYHERAIVINERNLIRLWDIAYDGYVGGKDGTHVNWNSDVDDPKIDPHSVPCFIQSTTDVTRPYRGPSMMVMAFHHTGAKNESSGAGGSVYKDHYRSNWPSPIVFYDRLEHGNADNARADFDNLHVVEVQQFRVFNSPLYQEAYRVYKDKMPDFWELHTIRKNAGLAATENEVSSDALAFQGTMRVINMDNGAVIQEVLGSGHHGPDFIGCASLRAGKGYRINSQPTIQRLV